jgi:hypothetical protein
METLYRVRVGQDEYLGTAAEVVAFMARGVGAPGADVDSYMRGVAARLRERMGIEALPTGDPEAFLDALAERRVLDVRRMAAPSEEPPRDPREVVGDEPYAFGEGVDPGDLDL